MLRMWLVAIVLSSLMAGAARAEIEELPFVRVSFTDAVNALAQEKGIRAHMQSPHRCAEEERGGLNVFFCEYWFLSLRTRIWSKSDGQPLLLISARVRPEDIGGRSLIGLALLIATLEGDVSDEEATNVAERLLNADRTLTGTVEISGRRVQLSSKVERDGLLIRISK